MLHPRVSPLRIAISRAVVPDTRNNNSGTSHHRGKAADGTALVGTRAAEIIKVVGIRTGVSLVIQRKGKGGRGHSRGTVVLQRKAAGAANRGTGNLHHSKVSHPLEAGRLASRLVLHRLLWRTASAAGAAAGVTRKRRWYRAGNGSSYRSVVFLIDQRCFLILCCLGGGGLLAGGLIAEAVDSHEDREEREAYQDGNPLPCRVFSHSADISSTRVSRWPEQRFRRWRWRIRRRI